MKVLGVLLIAFALFMRGDPMCAAPHAPTAIAATLCDRAMDEDTHSHGRTEMAGNCISCLLVSASMPTQHAQLEWSKLPFEFQAKLQRDGFGAAPPIPPPRFQSGPDYKPFNGELS